jgi:hypothetical protein
MSLPARIAVFLLACLVCAGVGCRLGLTIKQGEWDASIVEAQAKAKAQQDRFNAALTAKNQAHADEVGRINDRLADALERLRKRPERMPDQARAACQGATGAELSGPDAGFLEREAARADELRSALTACYAWVDRAAALGGAD